MTETPDTSQDLPFPGQSLSERQQAAVTLLVSGKTYTAVAEELGIDRRTLWEWRQTPVFSEAVEAELTALRTETRARMSALATKAVTAVERIIENGYTDAEKLAAVRLVFKWLDGERVQKLVGQRGCGSALPLVPTVRLVAPSVASARAHHAQMSSFKHRAVV